MKIVQAQITPITPLNGQAILKRIEEIARTCYRSEDKITEGMGAKPDELSLILPQSTAAEFCITANCRAWNNIFNLRAVGHSRPCVKQIMIPTLQLFARKIPVLFDDVYSKMVAEKQKQR